MQCQLPGLQFPFNVQRKNKIVVDTIMQQAIHYKVKSTSFCQIAYILLNYAPKPVQTCVAYRIMQAFTRI